MEMGGRAETFFNTVIWVGKEENICRQKKPARKTFLAL